MWRAKALCRNECKLGDRLAITKDAAVSLWKGRRYLMWYRVSSESMVTQCKGDQEKGFCNRRMTNLKKGQVVYLFVFRQENTSLVQMRLVFSHHTHKLLSFLKNSFQWLLRQKHSPWILPPLVESGASFLVLREPRKQTVAVFCVTLHTTEGLPWWLRW